MILKSCALKTLLFALLILSRLSFAQDRDREKCEAELTGAASSYVKLVKKALEENILHEMDLGFIAAQAHPVNPFGTKATTSLSASFRSGFQQVLELTSLESQWSEVRKAVVALQGLAQQSAQATQVAKERTKAIFHPQVLLGLGTSHVDYSQVSLDANGDVRIIRYHADHGHRDDPHAGFSVYNQTSKSEDYKVKSLDPSSARYSDQIHFRWNQRNELEGVVLRYDQKLEFRNFTTGIINGSIDTIQGEAIPKGGFIEHWDLSDGTPFVLFDKLHSVRAWHHQKERIIQGHLLSPVYLAPTGSRYFATGDRWNFHVYSIDQAGNIEQIMTRTKPQYPTPPASLFMDSLGQLHMAVQEGADIVFFELLRARYPKPIHRLKDVPNQNVPSRGLGYWSEHRGRVLFQVAADKSLFVVDPISKKTVMNIEAKGRLRTSPWFQAPTDKEPTFLVFTNINTVKLPDLERNKLSRGTKLRSWLVDKHEQDYTISILPGPNRLPSIVMVASNEVCHSQLYEMAE